ncbi:hypothetical protein A6R68_14326, partial [Neotoma lepida]
LNLSNSDILTIYDGDEVVPHVLGQYFGTSSPQKLYSSTPDLTIQFHSDPAGLIFGKGQGFIMNYIVHTSPSTTTTTAITIATTITIATINNNPIPTTTITITITTITIPAATMIPIAY